MQRQVKRRNGTSPGNVGFVMPTKEGYMEKEKKEAEIEYIINLLKKASPEAVHKMFIGATILLDK